MSGGRSWQRLDGEAVNLGPVVDTHAHLALCEADEDELVAAAR